MKQALLLMLAAVLFISCGEKKDPAAETKAKNIAAFKLFDSILLAGDLAGLDRVIAADYVEHHPMPGMEPTREGLKKGFAEMKKGWPDMKWKYNNIWADGDFVIGHYTMEGTNSGPMMGMPPTNKKINIGGVDIVRFKDGMAVEHWMYMEENKMMTQLGLMPDMSQMPAPSTDSAKPAEAKK